MRKAAFFLSVIIAISAVLFSGCSYSMRSLAYEKSTKIYIKPFENKVDLNIREEYSDRNPYRLYRPGMETKITDAVINRFLLDGYLKVVSSEAQADLVLKGELTNYEKQPLRYNEATKDVEEYRANIIVNMTLIDLKKDKAVWTENGFVGYTEFALVGPKAISEDAAINDAIGDLARRVVERTVEDW
ncbi:MAG: LPS assembly lipoprotein LptE [Candidatus Omnitrophota bacterium]|nr:LPS assembly lipoprotein LptE [Candidatus Omnitrophota bacterium]